MLNQVIVIIDSFQYLIEEKGLIVALFFICETLAIIQSQHFIAWLVYINSLS